MAIIAIAAILAHFGAETLQMPWLREVAVLVILAEILVFVALERYQVFEPMRATMDDLQARFTRFESFREELSASGGVSIQPSPRQYYWEAARALREAVAADPGGPQILRQAFLGLRWEGVAGAAREETEEARARLEWLEAYRAFVLEAGAASKGPWAHLWSVRNLFAVADLKDFEAIQGGPFRYVHERTPRNMTVKIIVHSIGAALSPTIIGERDSFLKFEDPSSPLVHWSIRFRGATAAALFTRWFDELWQMPEAYTVYTRDGTNQQGHEQVRKRLEALNKSN
jgi:hypothetical protein